MPCFCVRPLPLVRIACVLLAAVSGASLPTARASDEAAFYDAREVGAQLIGERTPDRVPVGVPLSPEVRSRAVSLLDDPIPRNRIGAAWLLYRSGAPATETDPAVLARLVASSIFGGSLLDRGTLEIPTNGIEERVVKALAANPLLSRAALSWIGAFGAPSPRALGELLLPAARAELARLIAERPADRGSVTRFAAVALRLALEGPRTPELARFVADVLGAAPFGPGNEAWASLRNALAHGVLGINGHERWDGNRFPEIYARLAEFSERDWQGLYRMPRRDRLGAWLALPESDARQRLLLRELARPSNFGRSLTLTREQEPRREPSAEDADKVTQTLKVLRARGSEDAATRAAILAELRRGRFLDEALVAWPALVAEAYPGVGLRPVSGTLVSARANRGWSFIPDARRLETLLGRSWDPAATAESTLALKLLALDPPRGEAGDALSRSLARPIAEILEREVTDDAGLARKMAAVDAAERLGIATPRVLAALARGSRAFLGASEPDHRQLTPRLDGTRLMDADEAMAAEARYRAFGALRHAIEADPTRLEASLSREIFAALPTHGDDAYPLYREMLDFALARPETPEAQRHLVGLFRSLHGDGAPKFHHAERNSAASVQAPEGEYRALLERFSTIRWTDRSASESLRDYLDHHAGARRVILVTDPGALARMGYPVSPQLLSDLREIRLRGLTPAKAGDFLEFEDGFRRPSPSMLDERAENLDKIRAWARSGQGKARPTGDVLAFPGGRAPAAALEPASAPASIAALEASLPPYLQFEDKRLDVGVRDRIRDAYGEKLVTAIERELGAGARRADGSLESLLLETRAFGPRDERVREALRRATELPGGSVRAESERLLARVALAAAEPSRCGPRFGGLRLVK